MTTLRVLGSHGRSGVSLRVHGARGSVAVPNVTLRVHGAHSRVAIPDAHLQILGSHGRAAAGQTRLRILGSHGWAIGINSRVRVLGARSVAVQETTVVISPAVVANLEPGASVTLSSNVPGTQWSLTGGTGTLVPGLGESIIVTPGLNTGTSAAVVAKVQATDPISGDTETADIPAWPVNTYQLLPSGVLSPVVDFVNQ